MDISRALHIAYASIADPSKWDSLIIHKRKPVTYRAFINHGDHRICLHKFEACEKSESFAHPHPWASSMLVLKGHYEMAVAHSIDLKSTDTRPVIDLRLGPGSIYHMNERQTWHQVVPRSSCYSLMLNGPRWEDAHERAPATAGKALQAMTDVELQQYLLAFKDLLEPYLHDESI